MNSGIEFERGTYGVKAVIKTTWQDSFLTLLLDREVTEVELNDGKGWSGENVNFLESLSSLKSLTIIDLNIKSVETIHSLNELKKLEIITYCKTPINFHFFPKVLECSFEWIKGSDSLFEMPNIKRLFINNYRGKSSDVFSRLTNLEDLSILNSPVENLHGISSLEKLKVLRLANLRKITALQGVENLHKLEELEVQKCKGISTISEVFSLYKLRRLLLLDLGDIVSIKGIEKLSGLEDFLFYESTNIIDGDISPVLELKKLAKVSFQNRKHYTHKREDFGKLYA